MISLRKAFFAIPHHLQTLGAGLLYFIEDNQMENSKRQC